jgi:putative PEP-CTERM system histidine kinase
MVHRVYAAGMVLLAVDALVTGFAIGASIPSDYFFWERARTYLLAFLPGVWLVFSLSYARANFRSILARWRGAIAVFFIFPMALVAFFQDSFFAGSALSERMTWEWFLALGESGYIFKLAAIAGSILVLMNLERTFRGTTGHMRWQVKFMLLGVAGLTGARIYTDSLAILYRVINTDLAVINAGALLVACGLMARSAVRSERMELDIYLSQNLLYNSVTVMLVGAYFVGVGLLAWLAKAWGGPWILPLTAFILMAAIMGLGALLMSDQLRIRRKRMISDIFRRPHYDYRKVWSEFTEKTSSVAGIRDLSGAVVRMVAETLEALSVSLWVVDEQRNALVLSGSTEFSQQRAKDLALSHEAGTAMFLAMYDRDKPVDIENNADERLRELTEAHGEALKEARVRYVVPVYGAGKLIALLTVAQRVSEDPLSSEDFELLKIIADQAGAGILSLRLSERVSEMKEMEALQVMSAFFMHDLKNLGARLSLVSQNLPVHYGNPEFRSDAIRTISQSVDKVNTLCSRLLMLSQKMEIRPVAADVNDLIRRSLAALDGHFKAAVQQDLQAMPPVPIDDEQIRKVLENLLLNANDAVNEGGYVRVATDFRDGWAEISVSDDGCGMTQEFIDKRLFRPFQTTKMKGMGIGLFHSKTIVEAHGGRLEVKSAEGLGTVFRVYLPGRKGSRGAA